MLNYRQNPSVEAAPMQGETVLYNPNTKKFCVLNGTAAFVWETVASISSPDEIGRAMCQRFEGVDAKTAARDVMGALEEFKDLDLVSAED